MPQQQPAKPLPTIRVKVREGKRYARKDRVEQARTDGKPPLVQYLRHVYEEGQYLEVQTAEYARMKDTLVTDEDAKREAAEAKATEQQQREKAGQSARDERQALKKSSQAALQASRVAFARRARDEASAQEALAKAVLGVGEE